jgi:hypothetical protein
VRGQDGSTAQPVFDTRTAAPLLGVKPGTLEVWRCKGIGPRFVKSGSRVVYRFRTRNSTADPGPEAE